MTYQRYQIYQHHPYATRQRYLPAVRSPLSQHSYSCDASLRVNRAKSFMAFLAKWSGIEYLKRKLEKRVRMSRPDDNIPAKKIKSEEHLLASLPADTTEEYLVQHALDMSARLHHTPSQRQILYTFSAASVKVTEQSAAIVMESESLGVGSFAEVRKGYDKRRSLVVACKLFNTATLVDSPRHQTTLAREIAALRMFNHPRIVKFEGLMVTKGKICILMEFVEGEEFFQYIVHKKILSEDEAKPLLKQIASTLVFMHSKGFVHRDLKLENIMISTEKTGAPSVKLIDFGLSRTDAQITPIMQTRCGSEEYAAPEILQGKAYNPRLCDAWSFGVIMYACLMGCLPFNPDDANGVQIRVGPRSLSSKIVAGKFYLPEGALSKGAAALIRCLLVTAPEFRMSIEQVLSSPYLSSTIV